MPIQMTQIVLMESYRQGFDFPDGNQDKVLEILLGKDIASTLIENKTEQYKNLKDGKCEAVGEASILFSLLPSTIESEKRFKFLISGQGRYRIYLKSDNILYYTADFRIKEQVFDSDTLYKGKMRIKFVQQLVNQFYTTEPAFRNSTPLLQKLREKYSPVELDVDIKLKENPKGKIFYLDYSANHPISVNGLKIGNLVFNHLDIYPEKYKVFDLRGLSKFVKNDY
jgi:predicted ribonuclease YlaK